MNQRTVRDAVVVIGGRIAFVALWFLAVLLVYRGLGADEAGMAQAGLFTVAIACVKIASGIIVDPVDVALMRKAPDLLRDDPASAFRLLWSAFAIRGALAGLVVLMLIAHAAGLGRGLAGTAGLAPLLGIVAAAILGDLLFRSVLVVLQAEQRFIHLVLLEGLLQGMRFAAIVILWLAGSMTVANVLACYAGVAFLAAGAGATLLLPRGVFAGFSVGRRELVDLLHFLKWMSPAMVLAALNERLDILLVYNVSGADDAGRYGAMLTLALVPDLVAGSLASIAQPRVARMREEGTFAQALRQFLRIALPVAVVAWLLAFVLADSLIPLALGPGYAAGVPILLWLLAGTLFWLAVTPLPMTMVAVHAPARIALVTAGQTVIVVVGAASLLPTYGPTGMAAAVCGMRVTVALALLVMAQRVGARPADASPAMASRP